MRNRAPKLFVVAFNIIASLLLFGNGKLFVQIDAIWVHLLFTLLIIWNLLLFYMLAKTDNN